jgi:hypothetical protein
MCQLDHRPSPLLALSLPNVISPPVVVSKPMAAKRKTTEGAIASKQEENIDTTAKHPKMLRVSYEANVDLPQNIVSHRDPLIQAIVQNYRHTASYWPTRDESGNCIIEKARMMPPIETCLTAHYYYMAGVDRARKKKNKLHLLVLCESHAVTPCVGNVSCEGGQQNLPFDYLNLVHCLAYGEAWLLSGGNVDTLTPAERKGMNNGTLPFWKLLSVMAGLQDLRDDGTDPLDQEDCFDFLMAKANKEDRLQAKKNIFRLLKNRGISLMDVSLFPIYAGGWKEIHYNKQTNTPYYTNMSVLKKARLLDLHFRTCWLHYTKAILKELCPDNLIVLSKTIDRAIGARTIRENMEQHGGCYCGGRIHPSTNLTAVERLAELREIRSIVANALASFEKDW